ncbi:unnamed protein product, partial [Polarella glacialis]
LHDGDHTPRQRAPNDAPMWQRLNAMKTNSKRWQADGVSSLIVFPAGAPLESRECAEGCEAPEDPVSRPRLFSEHWSRVSSQPVSAPGRVEVVRLPGSHGCGNASRPLTAIPAGLEDLRRMLPQLFTGHCETEGPAGWNLKTNFLLVDLTLGQALLVGEGAQLVMPDGSMPSLGENGLPSGAGPLRASDHLLHAQRLSRWLRKLPENYRGWIVVAEEALAVWQQRFVDAGRRFVLTAPACISDAAVTGGKKFRLTPGSTWCGDGGWGHVGHFTALRSKTSVLEQHRLPICISLNRLNYAYRFERSDRGCIGKHGPSGTTWTHAHTIYTSTEATGNEYCVGVQVAAESTRWTMQKAARCDGAGFVHSFNFRAMTTDHDPVLTPSCLLAA